VLDIGFAGAPDDQPGGEALFVLTRDAILIVTKRKRGIFKAAEPRVTTFPYAKFKGFVEDDDLGESVMVLVGHSEDDLLAFSWGSASERHRMFLALWAAHNAAQRTA
jgi:hypothetical protein